MKTPTKIEPIFDGEQRLFFFSNGYGASVVKHAHSYGGRNGLWELAVVHGNESAWDLDYSTEVTSDVIGHLNEAEVDAFLTQIEALPTLK
jgi:hypothetical protein